MLKKRGKMKSRGKYDGEEDYVAVEEKKKSALNSVYHPKEEDLCTVRFGKTPEKGQLRKQILNPSDPLNCPTMQ